MLGDDLASKRNVFLVENHLGMEAARIAGPVAVVEHHRRRYKIQARRETGAPCEIGLNDGLTKSACAVVVSHCRYLVEAWSRLWAPGTHLRHWRAGEATVIEYHKCRSKVHTGSRTTDAANTNLGTW